MADNSSAVAISAAPETAVYDLVMSRSEDTFTASWKFPPMASDEENAARWGKVTVEWWLSVWVSEKKYVEEAKSHKNGRTNGRYVSYLVKTESLANSKTSGRSFTEMTESSCFLNKKDFYPWMCKGQILTTGKYVVNAGIKTKNKYLLLDRLDVYVYGSNKNYGRSTAATPMASYIFELPEKPNISLAIDDSTGVVTLHVDAGDEYQEHDRKSTRYVIKSVANFGNTKEQTLRTNDATGTVGETDTSFDAPTQDSRALSLYGTRQLLITAEAYNLGFAGAGERALARLVLVTPERPSLSKKYAFSDSANPKALDGVIYLPATIPRGGIWPSLQIEDPGNDPYPKKVTLQRAIGKESSAQDVMDNGSWSDVKTDDYLCQGFTDLTIDALPDRGERTWYRIKAENYGFVVYSDPVQISEWYEKEATAEDDAVTIVDVYPSAEDPARMIVILTWADDDSTGNELTWSEYTWAWGSDMSPKSWTGQWGCNDAARNEYIEKYGPDAIKDHIMRVNITDVEFGKKYYIRARRYLEGDSGTTYSPYSYWRGDVNIVSGQIVPVYIARKPKDVIFNVPSSLAVGKTLPVSWSFDSESDQSYWQIVAVREDSNTREVVRTVLATGTNKNDRSAIISSELVSTATSNYHYRSLYLELTLAAHGNEVVTKKTVNIISPPLLTLYTYGSGSTLAGALKLNTLTGRLTLLAQPLRIFCKTDSVDCYVTVKIIARKTASTLRPDGTVRVQSYGEVIWNAVGRPPAADTKFEISAPDVLDFIDGSSYRIEAVAKNTYGLISEKRTFDFDVDWSNKAVALDGCRATASENDRCVYLTPASNTRLSGENVCDIYRITPESAELIISGAPIAVINNGTVVAGTFIKWADYLAPFSTTGYKFTNPDQSVARLRYRFVTRTSDGDLQWIDVPYNLHCGSVMLNWGEWKAKKGFDHVLEVPYNIVINDSYTKSFESRTHLDGSIAGYWGPGVSRSRSINTDVIKYDNAEQIETIRHLARYSGAVFVRTPDGCAFPANVEVNSLDYEYNNPVIAVSFDITELSMTNAFRHPSGIK